MSTVSKVVLVTGGSAGLGAAIARCLAEQANMRVVINYNSNANRAQALVDQLNHDNVSKEANGVKQISNRHVAIKGNLQDRTAVKGLVEQTYSVMGRLDVVISNVGWTRVRDFMKLEDNVDEDDWDRCFNTNVKSHLWLFDAARSHLDETQGVFISTASVAGIKPSGSSIPYAVTKAALIHLVKCLALVAAPNIRVNAVAPGILLTDWGRSFPQERLDAARDASTLKRFATVEDVAEQVKFFALSNSTTGQIAVIDAGFSL